MLKLVSTEPRCSVQVHTAGSVSHINFNHKDFKTPLTFLPFMKHGSSCFCYLGRGYFRDVAKLLWDIKTGDWAAAVIGLIGIVENGVYDATAEEAFDFQKLEDLAVETLDISKEILDILKYEDIKEIKEDIEEEHNNLMDIMSIANPNTDFEAYQKWANKVAYYKIEDTLSALHTDLISTESDTNILHQIKDDLYDKINEDSIHTETLTRGVTNYYFSLQVWQALGYSLLFKANDILHGPTANNFYYRLMISRISEQNEKLEEIIETIDDSNNYIVRDLNSIPITCVNSLRIANTPQVHLGGVEADDDKVVIGFTFIRIDNGDGGNDRLAISIKQGELKEMGIIGEENWKDPDPQLSTSDQDGVEYATFFDTYLWDGYTAYYIDWSFVRADEGKAIVGIKFCLAGSGSGRRVGLCIKTKKVNFAAGELGTADEWSDAPWKDDGSGEGEFRWDDGGWWGIKIIFKFHEVMKLYCLRKMSELNQIPQQCSLELD